VKSIGWCERPSGSPTRARRWTHVGQSVFVAVLVASALISCKTEVSLGNVDGHVSSLGPVYLDGDTIVAHFTVYDREGDDVAVIVTYETDGVEREIPRSSLDPIALERLPTVRTTHSPHVIRWQFAQDGVDASTPFVLRIHARERDGVRLESGPHTAASLAVLPPPHVSDSEGEAEDADATPDTEEPAAEP